MKPRMEEWSPLTRITFLLVLNSAHVLRIFAPFHSQLSLLRPGKNECTQIHSRQSISIYVECYVKTSLLSVVFTSKCVGKFDIVLDLQSNVILKFPNALRSNYNRHDTIHAMVFSFVPIFLQGYRFGVCLGA